MNIEFAFHTEDPALRELCRKYWNRGPDGKFVWTVSSLADSIDAATSDMARIVGEYCSVYDRADACSRCRRVRPFTSRADLLRRGSYRSQQNWVCSECHESERIAQENENRLKFQRAVELLEREVELATNRGVAISRMTFRDVVYLVSLLRACGSEDLSSIAPLESVSSPPLSPSVDLDRDVVIHLYRRGLICVHPGSRQEAIVIADGVFKEFITRRVHWILPIGPGGQTPVSLFEQLEALLRADTLTEGWQAEAGNMQRELALEECLQYLRVVMEEHRFEPNIGDKTRAVLRAVLNDFSIGQCYSFIWRAAKDAASFYLRENASKAHAVNIVPGALQRMAERAIVQGWQTSSFRRDFRAPLSVLSHVLFTSALHLPDDGFTTVPPSEEAVAAAFAKAVDAGTVRE